MFIVNINETADAFLDTRKCSELGYGFETVSDAICYIDSGLKYLAEHMHDENYRTTCDRWLKHIQEASDCIGVFWH